MIQTMILFGLVLSRGDELGEERPDLSVDLISDGTDLVDASSRWIVELPIEIPLPREDRARVSAAHRDHDIRPFDGFLGEGLRILGGDVDPDLPHRLDDRGVDLVGRIAARRPHHDPSLGVLRQQTRGHLAPPGVVDADEENLGEARVGHGLVALTLAP